MRLVSFVSSRFPVVCISKRGAVQWRGTARADRTIYSTDSILTHKWTAHY